MYFLTSLVQYDGASWNSCLMLIFVVDQLRLDLARSRLLSRSLDQLPHSHRLRDVNLPTYLKGLPPDSTMLMYLGDHVGALQQAGIPLRRVINEGNHRTWKQPVDPDGLWERALANPAQYADFVIAFDGDPVSTACRSRSCSRLR